MTRDEFTPTVSEPCVMTAPESTCQTGIFTLPLDGLRLKDVPRVGGKAARLGEMIAAGLPVPPGCVITTDAWRCFVQSDSRIPEWLRHLESCDPCDLAALRAAANTARARLDAVPVPDEVAEVILAVLAQEPGGAWAVRSSATVEDLADASFAGQHDSFLDVRGDAAVLAAVKNCWLSVYSERAVSYRKRKGIAPGRVQMAAIIQHYVSTSAAGVMFTADPSFKAGDTVVVEAAFGLGEAVVQGKVAPDRIFLSRSPVCVDRREAGQITLPLLSRGVDFREKPGSADPASRQVLDDGKAIRLARLGLEAEQVLGGPLDIEWGLGGTVLWLFQARPVTGLAEGVRSNFADRQVWTNANTGEVLPDVVTPMTWSLVRLVAGDLFDVLLRVGGLQIEDDQLFGLIAGRAYFNFNTICALSRQVPGASDRDLTNLFGGHQEAVLALRKFKITESDLPRIKVRRWRAAVHLAAALPGLLFRPTHRARAAVAFVRRLNVDLNRLQPELLSDGGLMAAITTTFVPQTIRKTGVLEAVGISALYCSLLFRLCDRWFGADGPGIANHLLAGVGGLDDAESGDELWQLAERAAHEPELKSILDASSTFETFAFRLRGCAGGGAFLSRWDEFMSRHGHHARGEIELFTPRWSECPDFVLEQLRGCVAAIDAGHPSPVDRRQVLLRERRSAERDCLGRLRNPFKRALFRLILRRAQAGSRLRENTKSELIRWLTNLRRLLLELGWRWFNSGRLADGNDIFFLEFPELQADHLPAPGKDLRAVVAARRAEYERNLKITPPGVIIGRFDPDHCPPEAVNGHLKTFYGLGVGAGVVTGRARVIRRSDAKDRLQPGEILVAPFTDPGWTPYFLTAGGIVMDLGGILSHGCIVAREYGIPAVVNVGPATQIIRTGQWLEVDANRGVVRVLDKAL